jgi:hypothetical protein
MKLKTLEKMEKNAKETNWLENFESMNITPENIDKIDKKLTLRDVANNVANNVAKEEETEMAKEEEAAEEVVASKNTTPDTYATA